MDRRQFLVLASGIILLPSCVNPAIVTSLARTVAHASITFLRFNGIASTKLAGSLAAIEISNTLLPSRPSKTYDFKHYQRVAVSDSERRVIQKLVQNKTRQLFTADDVLSVANNIVTIAETFKKGELEHYVTYWGDAEPSIVTNDSGSNLVSSSGNPIYTESTTIEESRGHVSECPVCSTARQLFIENPNIIEV